MKIKITRVEFLQMALIAACAILASKLLFVSLSGPYPTSHSPKKTIKVNPTITDRNGVKLAVTLDTVSLYTHPRHIIEKQQLATKLHNILQDVSYDKIYNKLDSDSSFTWIKRHLTPNEQDSINKLGIHNLHFHHDKKRVYIFGEIFSHLLGYVDIDGNPLSGLELYLEENNKHAEQEVRLSVDSRVQNILYTELNKTVAKHKAIGGTAIVLDANNSEIIAMVSIPSFNPHHISKSTENERFNRATLGLYEFGSILKVFTIAAALDSHSINLNNKYDIATPITVGGHTIKETYSYPTSRLSVEQILMYSSNVGMIQIGLQLGSELQKKYFERMGFFSPLKVEIVEKVNTITPKSWNKSTTAAVSYGYGISSTLLHVAQATAAVVNGGHFTAATLILNQHNKNIAAISLETSNTMNLLMRQVVKNGTGRRANATGYNVGGKTGTGEKSIKGVYNKSANISSFIAAFPMANPRYVVALAVDEPKPQGNNNKSVTGGVVAAPAVKTIISRIAPILNVSPHTT